MAAGPTTSLGRSDLALNVLAWLGSPALEFGATRLSMAECLGFATGILCVLLTARRSIWNFPVGIANCALLFLLFFESRLLADAALQMAFIALSLRGWWQWARHGAAPVRPITKATSSELVRACAASMLLLLLLVPILWYARGSVPVFDGSITALSLVAQWLLNRKVMQNWYWWMAVDVISIPVYIYKELYLIALLYFVFLVICVAGYRAWRMEWLAGQRESQLVTEHAV